MNVMVASVRDLRQTSNPQLGVRADRMGRSGSNVLLYRRRRITGAKLMASSNSNCGCNIPPLQSTLCQS